MSNTDLVPAPLTYCQLIGFERRLSVHTICTQVFLRVIAAVLPERLLKYPFCFEIVEPVVQFSLPRQPPNLGFDSAPYHHGNVKWLSIESGEGPVIHGRTEISTGHDGLVPHSFNPSLVRLSQMR